MPAYQIGQLSDSPVRFFVPRRERVYITARACELEFGGTKGLQAAGAGGPREFSLTSAGTKRPGQVKFLAENLSLAPD